MCLKRWQISRRFLDVKSMGDGHYRIRADGETRRPVAEPMRLKPIKSESEFLKTIEKENTIGLSCQN